MSSTLSYYPPVEHGVVNYTSNYSGDLFLRWDDSEDRETCRTCGGTGLDRDEVEECWTCGGEGEIVPIESLLAG